MTGYDVLINGQQVSAAIDKGVLTLIITRLNNDSNNYISLDLGGLDTNTQQQISWSKTALKEGDEIVVKIKKIDEVTTPLETKIIDEKELKQRRLENFYALKENLEKEGLL